MNSTHVEASGAGISFLCIFPDKMVHIFTLFDDHSGGCRGMKIIQDSESGENIASLC